MSREHHHGPALLAVLATMTALLCRCSAAPSSEPVSSGNEWLAASDEALTADTKKHHKHNHQDAGVDSGDASAADGSTDSGTDTGATDGATPADLIASPSILTFDVTCNAPAPPGQTLTLTNEGGAAVTWTATFPSELTVSPTTSTLNPGASVSISVAVPPEGTGGVQPTSFGTGYPVLIQTPTQTLNIQVQATIELGCLFFGSVPNVNFGDVVVGGSATANVPTPTLECAGTSGFVELGGGAGSPFEIVANNGPTWEIEFRPTSVGLQTTSFVFSAVAMPVCDGSAISFAVSGTGVLADAGAEE